jgi:L-seryl-tRNA(Ser) seleniumtransferase
MIAATEDFVEALAVAWRKHLGQGEIIPGRSTVGGGSLPEETLPTTLLALEVKHPNAFAGRLREVDPPIIARVEDDRVVFDPRTVLADQEDDLLTGIELVLRR